MSTSREVVRDVLAALLETELVGEGLPVKIVVGHKVTSLEGNTPLVCVLSQGTDREVLTFEDNNAVFFFTIQTWVMQAGGLSWTYAKAEDALDEIESLIANVVAGNRSTENWIMLEYVGASEVVEVVVSGIPYYSEGVQVRVTRGGV